MLVKTQFSIKDLENLSGVKAHTIRIWEKRYNLLKPTRTDTNIRKYDLINLKKLLNITFLYNEGYKISKIASFKEDEISKLINSSAHKNIESFAQKSFKTAMFDFDRELFIKTYNALIDEKTFEELFFETFMPLLNEIGTLWQTGTIDPVHERFISELIKQKISVNIGNKQEAITKREGPNFVLYLPYEEVHEIGLLFANYTLISEGYNTIYLGANIPISSLKHVLKQYNNIIFVSYFTIKPETESIYDYAERFYKTINYGKEVSLWLMGHKVITIEENKLPPNSKVIPNLEAFKNNIKNLKIQ